MPPFNFENLLKISVPTILIFGIVNLTSYYYQFNIPIIEFLDITEVTSLFLSDIGTYLIFILPLLLLIDAKKQSPRIISKTWVIICLLLVIGGIFFMNQRSFTTDWKTLVTIFLFICQASFLFILEYIKSTKKKVFTDPDYWLFTIIVFTVFICCISIKGILAAYDIKKHHSYIGTEVTINGVVIKSDSTLDFIGKTKGYIFFFNEKSHSPAIYPTDKMEKIFLHTTKQTTGGMETPRQPPLDP